MNVTTTNNNQQSPENILELAKKAAYVALRTMSIKSGDPNMQKLQLSIPHYPDCNSDAQDIVSAAALAYLEAEADGSENAFLDAVRAVHRYVYGQKQKQADNKHIWIDDPETGEIENVNNNIHRLLNCIYTDEVINTISAALSPTQRKILKYMAYGYTNITIAKRLTISDKTVSVHVARIRAKAKELFPHGIETE